MRSNSQRLRLAVVAPVQLPVPPLGAGGTERIINDLIRSVVKQGHTVDCFAPTDSRVFETEGVGGRGNYPFPSLASLRAEHARVPGATGSVLDAAMLESVRVRADQYDAIHCHTEFAHAAVLGDHRSRTLTTVHWRCDELDRQVFFQSFPDLPVAAISRSQAQAIPSSNLRGVVYHGFPVDRYVRGEGGSYLAFVGRMTDQKRPDRAIDLAKHVDLPLRLAGNIDPGNPTYFRDRVAPDLGDRIEYVSEVDDPGKQDLLGNALAFVFPIDWPEPFGLVMIEAMACGTPVIAWRNGSVPEIVEHGVTGFIVDTMDEAVDAVRRVGEIDRLLVRKRFEERFTSDIMARKYVELYRALG